MIGAFTSRLAVEIPDGELRTFTAPLDWASSTMYVATNEIVHSSGFSFIGSLQVEFAVAPRVGDIISFLYPSD